MKRFVIPVTTGATGIVTEGPKICKKIPRKHSIDSLQESSCTRDIAHNNESATI
jgi:hypothetical protein